MAPAQRPLLPSGSTNSAADGDTKRVREPGAPWQGGVPEGARRGVHSAQGDWWQRFAEVLRSGGHKTVNSRGFMFSAVSVGHVGWS